MKLPGVLAFRPAEPPVRFTRSDSHELMFASLAERTFGYKP